MTAPDTRPALTTEPSLALRELLDLLELQGLEVKSKAPSRTCARYYDDPLGFIDNCISFPEPPRKAKKARTPGLAPYQREIIALIPEKKRVAVRGPRGLGKTTLAALAVWWFVLTREVAGVEWKVMTTAGSWQQLRAFLWPEIRKWSHHIVWENVGRKPLIDRIELQQHGIRLTHGLAEAGSPDAPEKLEGLHGDSIAYIYDEAKLLGPATFESAEGAFSAADEETGLEAFALAISTPGEPAGPFYSMHRHAPEMEDWHPRHVTLEETIAAGRISRAWAERRKRIWGETSALYQNHVLGEFCSNDEDAIVPLVWAEAAVERWRAWDAEGRQDPGEPHVIGVDVASTGSDKSAAAIRWGNIVTDVRSWRRADTMVTTGQVVALLNADPLATAVVDVIGVGAGVYDRLREQGHRTDAFDVRRKTMRRDATGQFGFVRLRDAAWYHMRELLDPARGATLALPPVDELLGDLTSLHFQHTSDGKVKVEEKAEMRKRLGRSPDMGDSVIAAMWAAQGSFLDAYRMVKCVNDACSRGVFYEKDERDQYRTHCPWCRTPLLEGEDGEVAEETEVPAPSVPAAIAAATPMGIMLPVSGGLAGLRALQSFGGLRR